MLGLCISVYYLEEGIILVGKGLITSIGYQCGVREMEIGVTLVVRGCWKNWISTIIKCILLC